MLLPLRGEAQTRYVADGPELRESLDEAAWSFLARQPCGRVTWTPDTRSASALRTSAEPLLATLRKQVGPLGMPSPAMESSRDVYADSLYTVTFVTARGRTRGVPVLGYLAWPNAHRDGPIAIVIPGANSSPEQAFGWRFPLSSALTFRDTPINGTATALLNQGFVVFVPFISDDYEYGYLLPWIELENLGASYRQRTGQGGTLSLIVPQILSGVDLALSLGASRTRSVVMVGWSEGAFLAAAAAAMDPRVSAVVKLMPPRDSHAMRTSPIGIRVNAAFSHLDCVLGDVEQAAMIAPRPLLFAWSDDDLSTLRSRPFWSERIVAGLRDVYRVAPPTSLRLIHSKKSGEAAVLQIAQWAAAQAKLRTATDTLRFPTPTFSHPVDAVDAQMQELVNYVSGVGRCEPLRPAVSVSDTVAFRRSATELRERVRAELRLRPRRDYGVRTLVRQLVNDGPEYRLEWLLLESTGEARRIGGLLATPRNGLKHPAVVSFDGNVGVSEAFGLPPNGRSAYLGAYADELAKAGAVVFVPYRPIFVSRGGSVLLPARLSDTHRLEFELDVAEASLDLLLAEPTVDRTDVIAYGISEAAFPALYAVALDERFTGLLFSNPLVSRRAYFELPGSVRSGAWQTELCTTTDIAMQYLIAPRRFTWEGDNTDLSEFNERPLSFLNSIHDVYRAVGATDAFHYRRHLSGHETHVRELRDVLPFRRRLTF